MTQKNIGKLKTKFREKYKEKGTKASISRNLSKITIEYNEGWYNHTNEFHTKASFTNGVLQISEETSYPFKEDYYSDMIHSFWEPLAKEKGLDAIIIPGLRTTLTKELMEKGYVKMDNAFHKEWSEHVETLHENTYIKVFHPENLDKTILLSKTVKETFKELKDEDVTMTTKTKVEQETFLLTYYYQGLNQTLSYEIAGGEFRFQFEDETSIAKNAEETKEVILSHFKKIYNKQKVKNIFNYPKIHFENYVKKNVKNLPDVVEKIYEYLKTKHLPKDIEEHFAIPKKNLVTARYSTRSWKDVQLFHLMDMLFILNEKNEMEVFPDTEYDKAKEKFEEECVRLAKLDVKMSMQGMDDYFMKTKTP